MKGNPPKRFAPAKKPPQKSAPAKKPPKTFQQLFDKWFLPFLLVAIGGVFVWTLWPWRK
jgi:hypothetical protein